jgi:hypothetical protein
MDASYAGVYGGGGFGSTVAGLAAQGGMHTVFSITILLLD